MDEEQQKKKLKMDVSEANTKKQAQW